MTSTTRKLRRAALGALAAGLLGAGGLVAAAPASGIGNGIPLSGGQETTGAHTGANGRFWYEIDGDEICYTLSVKGLSVPATAAHIHLAPRNVAGGIVVPLTVGAGTTFSVSACTTASADLLADIMANPRAYYVNVHTPTWPGGEVRGQLLP